MKSYEKTEEPKKQQGQMGFHLVLQLLNQVNLAAQHAVQFVQDSISNGVQKVKEFAYLSSPCTPDDSLDDCEDRDSDIDFDVSSENSHKCTNRKLNGVTRVRQSSLSLLSEDKEGLKNGARPRRARFRGTTPKSHISRGRGAKFTTLRVLLLFCYMLSMVDGAEAASNGRPTPRSIPQLYLITAVIFYACAFIKATRAAVCHATQAELDSNKRAKPIFRLPWQRKHLLSSDSTSMFVFRRETSKPNSETEPQGQSHRDNQLPHAQLLPNSRTVCVLASEAAAASVSTTAAMIPDGTSNSYSANVGFEAPNSLYPHQRLEPSCSSPPALMAVSDPIPENGSRNPQLHHRFSKLVVGNEGSSPDPQDIHICSRSGGIGNLSISRTVSKPCEDSDLQSFNTEADSVPVDEVLNDASVLPSGGGRGQGENRSADREEWICRPFVDSASGSEDDDDTSERWMMQH